MESTLSSEERKALMRRHEAAMDVIRYQPTTIEDREELLLAVLAPKTAKLQKVAVAA